MAANLSGMFNQLNQAIGRSPVGAAQGLLDQTSRGFGGAMGAATGSDPYSFMNQGAKQLQGQQDLSGVDLTSAVGLENAAGIYGKMGETTNQVAMSQAAQKQKQLELKLMQEQKLRESLAQKAIALDLPDYAEQVSTGAVDLAEAGKALRELEVNDMLTKRGVQGRKAVAQRAGITPEQFKELNLGAMEDDQFKAFTQGLEGDVKPYMTASGAPSMIRTNKYGQVWDKDGQKWMAPSEMGLKPAPLLSKVHNVSNKMVDELAMTGVENFNDLFTRANDAVVTMDNIGRNLPLVDKMPTGTLAQAELFFRKVGEMIGLPYSEAANAEVYKAEAGQRVAKEIKAFGAGTGLSDKDREFAEQMAGGDISVTPAALKRILRIRSRVAEGTIKNFEDTKASIRPRLGSDGNILDMYTLRAPQTAVTRLIYNTETGTLE